MMHSRSPFPFPALDLALSLPMHVPEFFHVSNSQSRQACRNMCGCFGIMNDCGLGAIPPRHRRHHDRLYHEAPMGGTTAVRCRAGGTSKCNSWSMPSTSSRGCPDRACGRASSQALDKILLPHGVGPMGTEDPVAGLRGGIIAVLIADAKKCSEEGIGFGPCL